MNANSGILSYGAYIPRLRLQRSAIFAANAWFAAGLKGLAMGERAIANWDEDSVTMAVEAARDCLTGFDRGTVTALSLASTTHPFADRLNSGIVKEALTLSDSISALDVAGSQRAGTSSLIQALNAGVNGGTQLCVASELRKARPASEGELVQGDAAAAILVGAGDPIARFIGSHSVTLDFVDHFRASGADFDYTWESRWIRDEGYSMLLGDALAAAIETLVVDPAKIDRLLIPITVRGVPEGLAKKLGVPAAAVADTLAPNVGDSGVAHPLLMLAAALEQARPGETIMLVGFGQGCDVLLFETTEAIANLPRRDGFSGALARGKADENYLRFLFHRGLLDLDRGMRAEADQKQPGTTLFRNRKTVLGLVGGRCTKTGTVQFPRSEISVNPTDRAIGTQEDYPLAEKQARIVTYTADSLTYSPAPPQYYGMIDFEGGGRMFTEFADVDAESIEVGLAMKMMFRIKAVDEKRDFIKYFWKAVPVQQPAAGE
ncbi:hydroxymethylglutaryl-CoA synthase family protein [Sphingobium terrigena]|jgi:3-hydroxy-3-methylglutaryl CoA synthase|uniref:Hydroxymethylglutaryl-CoA synthase family protein n=1 Tax=Sphingobium terrigena TaxID=2304063 RepID=A0A418YP40_9SPHN|nr:OB-fold domain-containing protein [Sphingobium sp. D43FB]PBN41716.1 3-hydroxy-3-methylglutaryl CoA synthase [Sphingobium sp. D43FB]RJG53054.1 hydroxymethylglutaryl-CoA synthase family protein [Sphingobium terrigena]